MKDEKVLLVYAAGGLFTLHELATNVFLKEAIWKQSKGRYEFLLPQSKEIRDFNQPNVAAHIRNTDLSHVVGSDAVLARFDGLELDAGMVVEFMLAKFLGKPTLILRSDSRRQSSDSFDEPYNLMVKNWPRTSFVHVDSLIEYTKAIQYKGDQESNFETDLAKEKRTIRQRMEALAEKIISGLDDLLTLPNPYPKKERERMYHLCRYFPGSGFEAILTPDKVDKVLSKLKSNMTL